LPASADAFFVRVLVSARVELSAFTRATGSSTIVGTA